MLKFFAYFKLKKTGLLLFFNAVCVLGLYKMAMLSMYNSVLATDQRPNIVFILADDYGYNDVGYHGSQIQTPNLDRLAYGGVRLENYYVQPICTPTRSQLLSGRYQIHNGLQHSFISKSQPNALPLGSDLLPERLKAAGYSTFMVGKWHLGFYKAEYLPTSRGFESFYGFYTGSEDYYTHQACDTINEKNICGYDLRANLTVDKTAIGKYSTNVFTDKAIEMLNRRNTSKPFFLYLAYQAVHSPMQVPGRYLSPYSHIKDNSRRIYAGMVSAMDEGVGNLTKALEAAGIMNNTIIIFSTDNGGEVYAGGNNWPLRGWKASLWEGGMRGVGFVYSSLLHNPGSVSRHLIHVSDWFPTLVAVANGSLDGTKPLDGVNQWDAISQNKSSARKELLHNIDELTSKCGMRAYSKLFDTRIPAAIRVGKWKLITGNPGPGEWVPEPISKYSRLLKPADREQCRYYKTMKNYWLFDIEADPSEHIDLSSRFPSQVKKLLRRLSFYQNSSVPVRYPAVDPKCDPKYHGGVWGPWVQDKQQSELTEVIYM